jgi:hypothetical protein
MNLTSPSLDHWRRTKRHGSTRHNSSGKRTLERLHDFSDSKTILTVNNFIFTARLLWCLFLPASITQGRISHHISSTTSPTISSKTHWTRLPVGSSFCPTARISPRCNITVSFSLALDRALSLILRVVAGTASNIPRATPSGASLPGQG